VGYKLELRLNITALTILPLGVRVGLCFISQLLQFESPLTADFYSLFLQSCQRRSGAAGRFSDAILRI